jgi:hypothetical protein
MRAGGLSAALLVGAVVAGCSGPSAGDGSSAVQGHDSTVGSPRPASSLPPPARDRADLVRRMTLAERARGTAQVSDVQQLGSDQPRQVATGQLGFASAGLEASVSWAAGREPAGVIQALILSRRILYARIRARTGKDVWARLRPGVKDDVSYLLYLSLAESVDPVSQLSEADSEIVSAIPTRIDDVPVIMYTLASRTASPGATGKAESDPTIRVAVDADGLPRRIQILGSSDPPHTETLAYSQWGAPVSIQPPPDGDVVDYTQPSMF